MITDSLNAALNKQIEKEIFSAHLYLAMSSWFDAQGLPGCAGWMRTQYDEEMIHAMKIFDYVNEAGGAATVPAIASPPAEWSTAIDAFSAAFEHEQQITQSINELYDLAGSEHDNASRVMLQWFITEQVEEEASVSLIVDQLKMIGEDRAALLVLDQRLGARPASAAAGPA